MDNSTLTEVGIFLSYYIFGLTHTFSQEYLAVLKRMDIISLIVIIILGLATFPLAFFVYYKLLTTHTFKLNYTFLLIVVAGIVVRSMPENRRKSETLI